MFEKKILIKKEAGIELFKIESPNYSYFVIRDNGKRYIRYSMIKAEELFNMLCGFAAR